MPVLLGFLAGGIDHRECLAVSNADGPPIAISNKGSLASFEQAEVLQVIGSKTAYTLSYLLQTRPAIVFDFAETAERSLQNVREHKYYSD